MHKNGQGSAQIGVKWSSEAPASDRGNANALGNANIEFCESVQTTAPNLC